MNFEQRLKQLERALNKNGIGTWWSRWDTKEFYVDAKFRELTQLNEQEFPRVFGSDWAAVMHPHDRERYYLIRDNMTPGEVYENYRRILRRDGSSIWVRVSLLVEESLDLGCLVVHGTLVDVTDELEKREIERQRQSGMNLGLDAAGLLVVELNLETGFAEVIAGQTEFPEYYKNNQLLDFWIEWTAGETGPLILEAQGKPGLRVEYQVCHPQTKELLQWMAIGFSVPFERDGEKFQIAYRYVIDDYVKAKQHAEDQSERSATLVDQMKQEQRNREKMFAVIGHELRTPLAAMSMMLSSELEQHNNETYQHLWANTKHLLNVLDDLKIVARPEELLNRESRLLPMNSEFRSLAQMLRPLAEEAGCELIVQTNISDDRRAYLPAQSIRQVIICLVKNALIHSGGDAVVLSLRADFPDDETVNLTIAVVDNGWGIPESEVEGLFEPFVRGNTEAEGTGLGLNICRDIATSVGGNINYRPVATGGSSFEFRMSATTESVNEMNSTEHEPKGGSNISDLRVLLLEDNKTIQMLSRAILTKLGASVSVADDGVLGLEILRREGADLIVSDIFMPNLDGYGFTRSARADGYSGPIIGVTAATIGNETDEMLRAGANMVLSKPLVGKKLLQALEQIKADLRPNLRFG